jgi:serine/threonine protein kinase
LLPRGAIVAGYRVDSVLGEGGMGVVYSANQLSLNRVVALKVLTGDLANDPGFRTRFKREGELQAGLEDDHIVTVYEAGETEDGLFIAMRLIAGPTLKDLIRDNQLEPRRSLRLLAQVAQALDHAHDAGLIHRDIKPQNILIGKGDHAYLADFGLTKAPDDTGRLTGTGQFIGTIDYVSPEQVQGEAATAASDCYSLTAVLYECLTGVAPFARPNEAATMYAHLTEPPPKISDQRPDLPPALDEVIAQGMAKDPEQRPTTARALTTAATRALASTPVVPVGGQQTRLSRPPGSAPAGQRTRAPADATASHAVAAAPPAGSTVRSEAIAAPPAPVTKESTQAPLREPARSRPTTSGPVRALLVIGVAAAAIAAGFLVGRGRAPAATAQLASAATFGHLQLRYPSAWQVGASAPKVPGMTFAEPLMLTSGDSGELAAGEVRGAAGPTLLPASFRTRLRGRLGAPEPVRVGQLQAYRYEGLGLAGLDRPLTVYAIPTSAGVATVVCWANARVESSFKTQCGQVVSTVRLLGAKSYPLGPSAAYASLLSRTLADLRASTRRPAGQLRTAGTPSAQSAAARRLAAAYATAASTLSQATVSPAVLDAHRSIISALRRLATAYSDAAAAASAGAVNAYRAAGQRVSAGSSALSYALHQLTGLGYTVGE